MRLARGLQRYPRGRSAMVHYQAAPSLRAAVAAYATAHAGEDWLCRHSADPVADPVAAAERLIADFSARFGAPPGLL